MTAMSRTYDSRTPILLPRLNVLLSRHYLPSITEPNEITSHLLIALYESLIQTRLVSIDRKDKSPSSQIRNMKFLLGTMVMAGWDVGLIDPVGVVEREESCLMDLVEVLVEIGRETYGLGVSMSGAESGGRELSTIEETSTVDDESDNSASTLGPLHRRAGEILSRIQELNPSLRASSPTPSTVSRGTQTSPPPSLFTPRPRKHRPTKRHSRVFPRKREKAIQTDDEAESGIPSSIPLSYSSDSSPSNPLPRTSRARTFSPRRTLSPAHSRSSSESRFRVDSPYTAALRRRRQLAMDSLRRNSKKHRVRVFSRNRDVADSTFAEDSDTSTPGRKPPSRRQRRVVDGSESTTDALTDLERRVRALRIYGGIEEERKTWLLNEIKKKEDSILHSVRRPHNRPCSGGSMGSVDSD